MGRLPRRSTATRSVGFRSKLQASTNERKSSQYTYTHTCENETSWVRALTALVLISVQIFGTARGRGRRESATSLAALDSVDFMRAAKASKGGRSIVAMNATARGGSVSRIVPKVEMVTALRTDVDTVVTEHGVAQIKDLPNRARAEALIQIAAPQFRDKLRDAL